MAHCCLWFVFLLFRSSISRIYVSISPHPGTDSPLTAPSLLHPLHRLHCSSLLAPDEPLCSTQQVDWRLAIRD